MQCDALIPLFHNTFYCVIPVGVDFDCLQSVWLKSVKSLMHHQCIDCLTQMFRKGRSIKNRNKKHRSLVTKETSPSPSTCCVRTRCSKFLYMGRGRSDISREGVFESPHASDRSGECQTLSLCTSGRCTSRERWTCGFWHTRGGSRCCTDCTRSSPVLRTVSCRNTSRGPRSHHLHITEK